MREVLRIGFALLGMVTFVVAGVPQSFAADEGAKIFQNSCVSCHNAQAQKDKLKGRQPTRSEWIDIIERMKGLGAEVPRKKQDVLVDYLVKIFGAEGDTPK